MNAVQNKCVNSTRACFSQNMLSLSKQWPLIFASALALLFVEQAGIIIGWSSPILGRLNSEDSPINVTSDEGSWIATMMPLASLFTTPFIGLSLQYLGRKYTILLAFLPVIISWLIIAFATTALELIIARVFTGIAMGMGYVTVPVYLGEISPDSIRGGIGVTVSTVANLGNLWIYCIGAYFDLWISSVTSALPILFIILYVWLPESPYFLLEKGRKEDARKNLKKLRNVDDVDKELEKMEASIVKNKSENGFKKIFTEARHRRALFICLGTITFAQYCGVATFMFYAHIIFQKAGDVDENLMAIVKAVLQLAISIGAAYVVDSWGKKPLLIASSIGCSISMACEGIYFYLHDNDYNVESIWWLPLAAMTMFNVSFMIGLGPISLAYVGELFHPDVKNITVSISSAYLNLSAFVVGQLYQVMVKYFGNAVPFFTFSVIGILSVIFCIFSVPETKGKSLDEIQYYMKHKKFKEINDS